MTRKLPFILILTLATLIAQAQQRTMQYTVERGNTLYSIARMFNMDVEEIMRLNKLSAPRIMVGQRILVYSNAPVITTEPIQTHPERPVEGGDVLDIDYLNNTEPAPQRESSTGNDQTPASPIASVEKLEQLLSWKDNTLFTTVEFFSALDTDGEAKLQEIKARINKIAQKADSNDVLFFHITNSPNGTQFRSIPTRSSLFLVDSLIDYLGHINKLKVLLFCDLGIDKRQMEQFSRDMSFLSPQTAIIASCWADPMTQPNGRIAKDPFVYQAILESLYGAADMNQDNAISLQELDIYINDRVRDLSQGQQFAGVIKTNLVEEETIIFRLR